VTPLQRTGAEKVPLYPPSLDPVGTALFSVSKMNWNETVGEKYAPAPPWRAGSYPFPSRLPGKIKINFGIRSLDFRIRTAQKFAAVGCLHPAASPNTEGIASDKPQPGLFFLLQQ
jgi:hypothetical protein